MRAAGEVELSCFELKRVELFLVSEFPGGREYEVRVAWHDARLLY